MIIKNKRFLFLDCIILCLIIFLGGCFSESNSQKIRKAVVAGSFYPKNKIELRNQLADYLSKVEIKHQKKNIKGLIVPHAGYAYSAQTAAFGFKQVEGKKYDTIVILAPSHRDPFSGATIYPGDGYETPLGTCQINKELASKIVKSSQNISFSDFGHRAEHALEVELPFIQTVLPNSKIVPIVIGEYDWRMCHNIGTAIAKTLVGENVLLVASTDLYHGNSYSECKRQSNKTLKAMAAMNPKELCLGLLGKNYAACGGAPAVILQVAAKALGAHSAKIVAETNSNDVTGQVGGYVVGYGTLVIFDNNDKKNLHKKEYPTIRVAAQKELLIKARTAIDLYLESQQIKTTVPNNNVLNEKRGVFVTLTHNGQLRGCIGHHESDKPLNELVPQMAIAAAVSDPRFKPLTQKELKNTKIKISVYLTNVYPIQDIDEFEMGTHGIILQKNGRSATYLPEVPTEAGWTTVNQEMESLCLKAGLNKNAWKNDAKFWVYKTQVFNETILK
jgi:MEMO1 family protein